MNQITTHWAERLARTDRTRRARFSGIGSSSESHGWRAHRPDDTENGTVLAVDGVPVAIVGPHGQFFHALTN